jgi:hypothetical protein
MAAATCTRLMCIPDRLKRAGCVPWGGLEPHN